ncbi:MAG: aldo/keto reductase [Planctomycetes bacterium]|nr:aldo/keto reductase [Planctomycetota bacterium]
MQTRPIPGTDLAVSSLSLGGWLTFGGSLDDATSLRILRTAVDRGVTFLDLADVYAHGAAERVVGQFLREVDGDQLVVSSKVFWPMSDDPGDRGLSRRHIHASIDNTLQRLGRDHLDLYFCHREDPGVPLAETVQAMGDLVAAGKVRAWGTSCWQAATLQQAWALADQLGVAPPRVEQPQYNLFDRWIEQEVVPMCAQLDMAIVVWSPLASGALTGKYLNGKPAGSRGATSRWVDDYLTPPRMRAVEQFVALCAERSLAPAAVALAWAMAQPGITSVITGATSEAQLQANLAAAEVVVDDALRAQLDAIFPPPRRSGWKRVIKRLLGRD